MSRVESTVSLSSSDVLSVSPARISVHTKSKRLKRASFSPLTCVCATARSYYSLLLLHGRVDFNFFFPLSAAIIFYPLLLCVFVSGRKEKEKTQQTNKQTNKRQPAGNFLFLFFLCCVTPLSCPRVPDSFQLGVTLFFSILFHGRNTECVLLFFVFLFFLSSFLFLPLRTCFCRTC
jgi:hypothetical protein